MASVRRSVVASVLFTVFGGPGILLVLMPWWITRWRLPAHGPAWPVAVAAMLIAVGLTPLLGSIVRFVAKGRGSLVPALPTERLVISGFYRYVRNPMYLGVFGILAGEAVMFRSFGVAAELAMIVLGACLFVHVYEEPKLSRTFGEEYRRYCAHVPRWVPRAAPWFGE